MKLVRLPLLLLLGVLAACGSSSHAVTPPPILAGDNPLDLEPGPVELTSDTPDAAFSVQNDVAGVNYTPTADPSCVTSSGGIYVAGDGQPLTAIAGTPTMFLTYALGTPPASCTVTVTDNVGNFGTVTTSYQTLVVQSKRRVPSRVVTRGITPPAVTITSLQPVSVAISGYTGNTSLSAGNCAQVPGIDVNPSTLTAGSGTVLVIPKGNGSISKSCTITISDAAGNHGTIPVTLAIAKIAKLTVSPSTVQFGCAPSTAPTHCRTIQQVTVSEAGATLFQIEPRAFPSTSCASVFEGPLRWVSASGAAVNGAGPTVTAAFDGILPARPLGCSRIPITDSGTPAQTFSIKVIPSITAAPPPAIAAAAAPPCVGSNSRVAVPSAPHGMYAWVTGPRQTFLLGKYVIGTGATQIDPTLCGASVVINWADVEPDRGKFQWKTQVEDVVNTFTARGLTVNLLFADATETGTTNATTPPWVLAEVPTYECNSTQQMPAYWNSVYEKEWSDFITQAVNYFSTMSSIKQNIGYMRFATGGGAEALPPPGYNDNGTCQQAWANLGYSNATWLQHELNMLDAMNTANTTLPAGALPHQLIASLPEVSGEPSIYDMPNTFAARAASYHIGLSFESLGSQGTTAPNTTPMACWTQAKITVLHWCQAYWKYAGVVPLNMQPITASTRTSRSGTPGPNPTPPSTPTPTPASSIDIANLLEYALLNNIQVFELYPDEWLEADNATTWEPLNPDPATQAYYAAALQKASLVLGATNGQ